MVDGEDWRTRVADNARRYQELQERLSQLSISETSRDGAVRVTVSSIGHLTGLTLTETAHPASLPELADQVMDSVRRAQARIPDLLRQALAESIDPGDPSAHLLVAEARRRFPEPPPSPREQPDWQPDEIRFTVPDPPGTSPAAPAAPAVRSSKSKRVQEELWEEERSILKDV